MRGDNIVFVVVSVILIFAFTAYEIWLVRRQARLVAEFKRILADAAKKNAESESGESESGESESGESESGESESGESKP